MLHMPPSQRLQPSLSLSLTHSAARRPPWPASDAQPPSKRSKGALPSPASQSRRPYSAAHAAQTEAEADTDEQLPCKRFRDLHLSTQSTPDAPHSHTATHAPSTHASIPAHSLAAAAPGHARDASRDEIMFLRPHAQGPAADMAEDGLDDEVDNGVLTLPAGVSLCFPQLVHPFLWFYLASFASPTLMPKSQNWIR